MCTLTAGLHEMAVQAEIHAVVILGLHMELPRQGAQILRRQAGADDGTVPPGIDVPEFFRLEDLRCSMVVVFSKQMRTIRNNNHKPNFSANDNQSHI